MTDDRMKLIKKSLKYSTTLPAGAAGGTPHMMGSGHSHHVHGPHCTHDHDHHHVHGPDCNHDHDDDNA